MLPNQEHTSIVSTLLVREVIKFDNIGYGSTLAMVLTLLVLVIVAVILGVKNLWLRSGRWNTGLHSKAAGTRPAG